jgi:hypothetical protein
MTSFKFYLDDFDRGTTFASPDLTARLYPAKQTWRDFLIEYREVPILQPVAIECRHTQERFE